MAVVWALARNTIAQAIRMKAAVVIIALFFVGTPAIPFMVEGDNSPDGLVKVVLTYTITVATGLLMALTVFLSAMVLDSEIVKRQIYLVYAKPVKCWQLIAGKWLGVALLDAWLLLIMGAITTCAVYWIARPDYKNPDNFRIINQQVLTSRSSYRPPLPDPERVMADIRRQMMADKGMMPKDFDEKTVLDELRRIADRKACSIPPGSSVAFIIEGVPQNKEQDAFYTIRYKLVSAGGGGEMLTFNWLVGRPDGSAVAYNQTTAKSGDAREFQVPAWVVDDKGQVCIELANLTIGNPDAEDEGARKSVAAGLSLTEGLELLAPSGGFLGNYARGLFLVWVRLALLAMIGIAATSIVHFPVAALLLFAVICYGYARDFIGVEFLKPSMETQKSLELEPGKASAQVQEYAGNKGYEVLKLFVAKLVAPLAPNFSATDPNPDFMVGREIGYMRCLWQLLFDLGLRGGIAFLVGTALLRNRELAIPE